MYYMKFTRKDRKFMKQAIIEAKKSCDKGNYPVGSVLVMDGKLIGKKGNIINSDKDWISHAENALLNKYSKLIKKKYLPSIIDSSKKPPEIELYTTLEPCLMCLGASILNRVSKIIYACPDPHGGATKIKIDGLPKWYKQKWPKIKEGLYKKESYRLLMEFMENQKEEYWKKTVKLFNELDIKN